MAEKNSTAEQIAAQQAELDKKAKALAEQEAAIKARTEELNSGAARLDSVQADLAAREQALAEREAAEQKNAVDELPEVARKTIIANAKLAYAESRVGALPDDATRRVEDERDAAIAQIAKDLFVEIVAVGPTEAACLVNGAPVKVKI